MATHGGSKVPICQGDCRSDWPLAESVVMFDAAWREGLGARVRLAREGLGWSQERLGELSGTSRHTVLRTEKGLLAGVPAEILAALCAAGVDAAWVLLGTEARKLHPKVPAQPRSPAEAEAVSAARKLLQGFGVGSRYEVVEAVEVAEEVGSYGQDRRILQLLRELRPAERTNIEQLVELFAGRGGGDAPRQGT